MALFRAGGILISIRKTGLLISAVRAAWKRPGPCCPKTSSATGSAMTTSTTTTPSSNPETAEIPT
jgi:hypothetical protein